MTGLSAGPATGPVPGAGRAHRLRAAAAAAGLLLTLGGCTALGGSDLNDEARAGDEKGYVAGDSSVMELEPGKRGEPITVSGTDTSGKPLSSNDFRGTVVVVNLWYAACGPCRDEAPDLAKVAGEADPAQVQFLGIDTRDDAPTAAAFEKTFATPYPSIVDTSGEAVLALRGVATPNAVPTTLVLDREGRVAARISGRVNPSVLSTLVSSTVAEKP